jgi:hypothetical protein
MNWSYIKNRDQSNISPIWRSFFQNFWCYSLLSDLYWEIRLEHGESRRFNIAAFYNAALAILFFFLITVAWRLPDPYWLVSLLCFVPLLHAVTDINALNGLSGYHYRRNSRLLFRHYALILLILPLMALVIAGSTGLVPSPTVVAGTELSERQARLIREFAELRPHEKIDFYYSNAFISFEEDGNIVTDERVVSYYLDDAGTGMVASAYFKEIVSLRVLLGTFFEPTVILVCLANDEYFTLYAGAQEKEDRRFVDTIKARLPRGTGFIIEEDEDFACEPQSGA